MRKKQKAINLLSTRILWQNCSLSLHIVTFPNHNNSTINQSKMKTTTDIFHTMMRRLNQHHIHSVKEELRIKKYLRNQSSPKQNKQSNSIKSKKSIMNHSAANGTLTENHLNYPQF